MSVLVLKVYGPGEPRELELEGTTVHIGRAESNDIRLVGPKCSREHCVVEALPDGSYLLRDRGSRNGTRLNGARTAQARLEPGDEIRIGEILIRYERHEHTPAASAHATAAPPRRTERRADRRHASPRLGLVAMVMILLSAGGAAIVWQGGGTIDDPIAPRAVAGAQGEGEHNDAASALDARSPIDDASYVATDESTETSETAATSDPSRTDSTNRLAASELPAPDGPQSRPRLASYPDPPAANRDDEAPSRPTDAVEPNESDTRQLADVALDSTPASRASDEPLSDDALYFLLQDVETRAEAFDYEAALAALDEGIERADSEQRDRLRNRRLDLVARRLAFDGIRRIIAKEDRPAVRIQAGFISGTTPQEIELVDGSKIAWASLRPSQFLRIAEQLPLSNEERVGLAAYCFDYESLYDEAHRVLEKLVLDDESAQPHIDTLLSRKLGVAIPNGGFRIWNHRWMTPLRYDQMVRESRFDEYRSAIIGGKFEDRIAAYAALRELGAPGIEALRELLPRCRDDIHMELRSAATFAALRDLREERLALEEARRRVLELVYDYEAYPTVYKRPKASKEAAEAYAKTQREIEKSIDRLEAAWRNGERRVVRLPTSFRKRLGELRTCLRWFDELALSLEPLDDADFLEVFPDTWQSVDLRSFPLSAKDVVGYEQSREIMAANLADASAASRDESEMLRICNEYRILLGRRAVRLDPTLVEAARGHSREMSTLGYFAHESPNPTHATPSDRALRAGFVGSHVGENIARGRVSARATHDLWTISPPHHRNLLSDEWTHLGVGRSGEYWTANYGRR